MKRVVALLFLLVVAMVRVSSDGAESIVKDFASNILDFKVGNSKEEIIKNLGKPINITKLATSKSFKEVFKCKGYITKYDGLQLSTFEGKECLIPKLYKIVLTSNKYKVKYNIGIGSSRAQIISVLGKPELTRGNVILYSCDPEGHGIDKRAVEIYFKDNKVSKIEWTDSNE